MNDPINIFENYHDTVKEDIGFYAVFVWVIYGAIRFFLYGGFSTFISWPSLIYFVVGMFFAALLSIPLYYLKMYAARILTRNRRKSKYAPIRPLTWILLIFDSLYIIVIAHFSFNFLVSFFNL